MKLSAIKMVTDDFELPVVFNGRSHAELNAAKESERLLSLVLPLNINKRFEQSCRSDRRCW